MDIHVSEMNSTVRTADSQMMLSPAMLQQIVEAVAARLQDRAAHEQRRLNEMRIEQGVSSTHCREQNGR